MASPYAGIGPERSLYYDVNEIHHGFCIIFVNSIFEGQVNNLPGLEISSSTLSHVFTSLGYYVTVFKDLIQSKY